MSGVKESLYQHFNMFGVARPRDSFPSFPFPLKTTNDTADATEKTHSPPGTVSPFISRSSDDTIAAALPATRHQHHLS